jgi:hypothetical protein
VPRVGLRKRAPENGLVGGANVRLHEGPKPLDEGLVDSELDRPGTGTCGAQLVVGVVAMLYDKLQEERSVEDGVENAVFILVEVVADVHRPLEGQLAQVSQRLPWREPDALHRHAFPLDNLDVGSKVGLRDQLDFAEENAALIGRLDAGTEKTGLPTDGSEPF